MQLLCTSSENNALHSLFKVCVQCTLNVTFLCQLLVLYYFMKTDTSTNSKHHPWFTTSPSDHCSISDE